MCLHKWLYDVEDQKLLEFDDNEVVEVVSEDNGVEADDDDFMQI